MKRIVAGLLLLGITTAANLADQADVILKDGRRLRGEVTETETHVIIKTAAGELPPIPKSEVARIIRRTTPDDEYKNKVSALDPGDLEGHFAVAEWASSNERWDLVVRQCMYILGLKRDHRNAKLLLEHARGKQADSANKASGADEKKADEEGSEADGGAAPFAPPLSKRDIQRLKINELSFSGGEDKIRVKFVRKRNAIDLARQFVKEMRGQEGYDDRWERRFLRKPTNEQVIDIVGATGLKYADRIEISGDPAVFSTYRRRVLPLIVRGCARSGCHGSSGRGFSFQRGSKQSESFAYTSFYLLDSMNTEQGRMINREDPHSSALLGFMLPREKSERPHPEVPRGGGPRFTPIIKRPSDRNLTMVLDWISSLALPRPEYKLDYKLPDTIEPVPPPAPLEIPADAPEKPGGDEPADEKPPAKKDDDKP